MGKKSFFERKKNDNRLFFKLVQQKEKINDLFIKNILNFIEICNSLLRAYLIILEYLGVYRLI